MSEIIYNQNEEQQVKINLRIILDNESKDNQFIMIKHENTDEFTDLDNDYLELLLNSTDDNSTKTIFLKNLKNELNSKVYSSLRMVDSLRQDIYNVNRLLDEICHHNWVPDRSRFEPCGPIPKMCTKCEMLD